MILYKYFLLCFKHYVQFLVKQVYCFFYSGIYLVEIVEAKAQVKEKGNCVLAIWLLLMLAPRSLGIYPWACVFACLRR